MKGHDWMILKGCIFTFLICLILNLAIDLKAEDLKEFKKEALDIQTIKADFVQTKHLKILSRPLVSKGLFVFKNPDYLRWEYRTPLKSILLIYKGDAKRYVKGSEGLTKDASSDLKSMNMVMEKIGLWMGGRFDEDPNFIADMIDKKTIVLNHRKDTFSKIINRIELVLSEKPGVIKQVKIFESEESFTLLEFLNPLVNENIKDSVFMEP